MITLYGFRNIFSAGIGETKDMRVEWALLETGLPYRVHGLDHTKGDLDSASFETISTFHQVPVIDDEGIIVAESGAILLYIAEKSGQLLPQDLAGRTHVTQWCFAAASTVSPTLSILALGDEAGLTSEGHAFWKKIAGRWLDGVERRLDDNAWIAGDAFTIADIMMAHVLREVRKTDLLQPYRGIVGYLERALARPAWRRASELYAERLGVSVAEIQ